VVDTRERRTVQAFLSLQEMIPPTLEDLPLVESGKDNDFAGGFLLNEKTENISREIHLFQKKGSIPE
ncbi:MAG TPA: hypothetical protein VKK79_02590, partial [Candidatus Lokiarchaeia archaeon]|nr:hypothetical protein [Candidatus Lokiarchaeia archaeon]